MEPAQAAMMLDKAFQLGAKTVISAVEHVASSRPHHHDFAMDRVIHEVLMTVLESTRELSTLTPYKDEANAGGTDRNSGTVV